jgi:hypothetical protein
MFHTWWRRSVEWKFSPAQRGDRSVAAHKGRPRALVLDSLEDRTLPSFITPFAAYGVATGPVAVAVGDFNNDGFQDLASVNYLANNVTVRLNDGTGAGTFSPVSMSFPTGGLGPNDIKARDCNGNPIDFNGDGNPDLVVANTDSSTVSVLLGDGLGGFGGPPLVFATGAAGPASVAVCDLDGDGAPDIITANYGLATAGTTVSVLLSSLGYAPVVLPIGGLRPDSVAVADFDGDGIPDIVTANQMSNNVSVLLSSLGYTPTVYPAGTFPEHVEVGDFNNDGHPDFAVTNAISNTVSVYQNTGAGGFVLVQTINVAAVGGNGPTGMAVADFNGDGYLDLVTANYNNNTLTVFLGFLGTGTFVPAPVMSLYSLPTGSDPISVAVGDFEPNGLPDVVVAGFYGNALYVGLNNGGPFGPGGSGGAAPSESSAFLPAGLSSKTKEATLVLAMAPNDAHTFDAGNEAQPAVPPAEKALAVRETTSLALVPRANELAAGTGPGEHHLPCGHRPVVLDRRAGRGGTEPGDAGSSETPTGESELDTTP